MTSTRTSERRASTRHAGLERHEVIDAALAIVTAEGGAALTMRRLAADLGVTTTTIYWHVGNREQLVVAIVERFAEEQSAIPVIGRTPRRRVLHAAMNLWRSARGHRNLTALASAAGATTLLELPLEAALAAELGAAGVHGERARDVVQAVLACIAGFLISEWRPAEQRPEALRPSELWSRVDDPRIDPSTLRALATAADHERLVESTLRAIIDAAVPETHRGTP